MLLKARYPKGYEKDMESFCQDSPREKQKSTSRVPVSSSSDYNEGNSRTEVSRKRKEPSREQPGDGKRTRARSAPPKKPRVIWTVELHNHFLDAIEALGVDKGVPKRILEYMRIPGLTRENVASHLQKYRIFVKNVVENNRDIEPSSVKSLASRAFPSIFATDAPTPISLQQNVSQRVPKYSFGSFQRGSEDGNFQGINTQSHSSHLSASMVVAGFQFGQSSITPMNNNNNKRFMASAQQPRPTTSVAAGNANQEDCFTISPAQSILNMSTRGGRSGTGTMQLVHQQNVMVWKKNILTTGPLNSSTRTVFESGNFQKQNNNALVENMGKTANTGSLSIGNSAQPSTLSSTNFTGIQIINDNTNSSGTLHIGTIVSNMPTSSVMEVPGMIPELVRLQSSYSAIEEPNSNLDYLNSEPFLVAPTEMSNMIPRPSDEVYFGGGIILNANHEYVAPRYETRVPITVPVAPSPLAQEAQQPEQVGEDEEHPFEVLYDIIRNDSALGISPHPLMNNYLNNEPSSVAPIEMSNRIPQPSCTNTNGFTALQYGASFGGGIIPDANHASVPQQQQTQVTKVPVAPAPFVQEAQQPEKAGVDEEDPFEGLYDLIRNDSDLGSSLTSFMENYLNNEPSSVTPMEIPQPSCKNTNGFTALQDETSSEGGIIVNANLESLAQQQLTQVLTTLPVAPAPLVQEAQHPAQAGEDEEDPFEGLYDLLSNDSNLENSFPPLMDNEDFVHFIQDFEKSNTDKGGEMYGGEDFLNQPRFRYKFM